MEFICELKVLFTLFLKLAEFVVGLWNDFQNSFCK